MQAENINAGNRMTTPEMNTHSPVLPILRLYIYLEVFQSGNSSRSTKKVERIRSISKRYRPGNQQQAYLATLEKASEIACAKVYELKERKENFNRVFISQFEDIEKARKDQNSLSYN